MRGIKRKVMVALACAIVSVAAMSAPFVGSAEAAGGGRVHPTGCANRCL